MRAGRGATISEHLTWCDLNQRTRVGIVSVEDIFSGILRSKGEVIAVPAGRERLSLSEPALTLCLAQYLRLSKELSLSTNEPEFVVGSPLPKAKRQGLGLMLYDSETKSGHVIQARVIADDMMSIAYDDSTWPGGKSFFSRGENSFGFDAAYLGPEAPGTWAVSIFALMRALYAIPIPVLLFDTWKDIGAEGDAQMAIASAKIDGRVGEAIAFSAKRKLKDWFKRK